MKSLYIVSMESEGFPEHPVGSVYDGQTRPNRLVNQYNALAVFTNHTVTMRIYRVDIPWWRDQHPVRFGLWKRVLKGGRRVSVVRTVRHTAAEATMDRAYITEWGRERMA